MHPRERKKMVCKIVTQETYSGFIASHGVVLCMLTLKKIHCCSQASMHRLTLLEETKPLAVNVHFLCYYN